MLLVAIGEPQSGLYPAGREFAAATFSTKIIHEQFG